MFLGETNLDALMTTLILAVDDCNLHNEREALEEVSLHNPTTDVYNRLS